MKSAPQLEILRAPAQGQRKADLLLVHGAWLSARCWEPYFMPYFAARGYSCTAVSLRGHGRSEGALRRASIDDYVSDLHCVARTLDDCFVVGHSMGGFVAQHYVGRYPARGLILLASVPHSGAWSAMLNVMRAAPLRTLQCLATLDLGPIARDLDAARRLLFSRDASRRDKDHFLERLGSESFLAFLGMLFSPAPRASARRAMPRAVIGAEADEMIGVADLRRTAGFYGVAPQLLAKSSHMLMLDDQWRAAAELMEAWLERQLLFPANSGSVGPSVRAASGARPPPSEPGAPTGGSRN